MIDKRESWRALWLTKRSVRVLHGVNGAQMWFLFQSTCTVSGRLWKPWVIVTEARSNSWGVASHHGLIIRFLCCGMPDPGARSSESRLVLLAKTEVMAAAPVYSNHLQLPPPLATQQKQAQKSCWEQLYSVFNCHLVTHLPSCSIFSGWAVIW